jgi:FAD synthase
LREEMIFKNAEDLAEKVKEDIEKAKELFLID